VGDQALQKAIDYACGAGADCTPILQNGACFQPNTVKDHCNYAVNSYFQRKGQAQGSCDFAGAATPSQNPPSKWPPLSSHLQNFWTFLIKFPFSNFSVCSCPYLFDLQLQHLHVFTPQVLGMFFIWILLISLNYSTIIHLFLQISISIFYLVFFYRQVVGCFLVVLNQFFPFTEHEGDPSCPFFSLH